MREYAIDGWRFSTLEEFYEEVGKQLNLEAGWGHNLDAFNDILRGGFGTPDEGFTLRWKHHDLSQERLGYPETARQLRLQRERCHPTARPAVERSLREAGRSRGPTVFDWLVEIIREHGPEGGEASSGVHLVLD